MTTLASGTWLTPFGVPFDTAVLAGLLLTVLAIALAGRRRKNDDTEPESGDRS
ncbi:LPXTG-motif cell wall anchor domain-containing protein [Prauserella marina]|uniref:LPXTG-motif cell wall anchor domain-containing protein n=1 Tax=Prauserella marina TaxID=530584 RepID=A0A1G6K9X2_9PSEU|nr:LPXTG cell wall anchor domain-containing protein [Prauserella marina]PWV84217.1 LPXTG-motif cell wall-anchored protein [Prauserella marina]SDC27810.1 LPXTG-motif cell wall anchor domain-containing protein [Prauserella marina]